MAFNPNQPRVAAGASTAGQWVSAGGVRATDVFLRAPNSAKEKRVSQTKASVESARSRLHALGIDTSRIKVLVTDQMPRNRPGGSAAENMRAEGVLGSTDNWESNIALNMNEKYWDHRYESQKELFESKMHSSKDSDHVAIHEFGHALHNDLSRGDQLSFGGLKAYNEDPAAYAAKVAKDGGIARTVSRYASKNPHEFVAEVFAAGISGRKFSPEVKALYEKFKGPHVDKVFR